MSASVEPATSLTGGNTWNCWANPGGIPCYPQLSGIDMVSADDGWVVGADTFLHWNGAEWRRFPTPEVQGLTDVDMISASEGWATSYLNGLLRWDGVRWARVANPYISPNLEWYHIDMISTTDGWGVTRNPNTLFRWNGCNWTLFPNSPASGSINDIFMLTSSDGWVVGDSGFIARWNGSTWSQVASPTAHSLMAITMQSPTDGWAVGGSRSHPALGRQCVGTGCQSNDQLPVFSCGNIGHKWLGCGRKWNDTALERRRLDLQRQSHHGTSPCRNCCVTHRRLGSRRRRRHPALERRRVD